MTREEKIKWFIDNAKHLCEEYPLEIVQAWDDQKLDFECDWLDEMLDK